MNRATLAVVLLVVLSSPPALAQNQWEAHTRAGEVEFSDGDLVRAEQELEQALEIANTLPAGDVRLETSLSNLARLYEHEGRLDQAQPLYELLIAACEHRAGVNSPDLLDAYSATGRVALRAGDVPAAAAHLKRYVELADSTGKADPAELWQVLGLLARMGTLQQSPEDALLYQRRAVAVMDQDRFPDAADRATQLETLAMLELFHGSTAAAESLLERVTELQREAGNQEAAIASLANAASAALSAGHLDLAERLVDKVLALNPGTEVAIAARRVVAEAAWQRLPGGGDLATWLAVHADTPELAQAAERLQALFNVQRLTLPAGHPDLVETLSRQVSVAARRGDLAGAEQAERLLVEGWRKASGHELAAALDDLVTLLVAAGKTAEAAANNNGLVEVLDHLHGADDPRLRPVLERQLALLTTLGRKQDAKLVRKRLKR